MIIYGSRMYGKSEKVSAWGICPHCNQYARNESYNGRKWGHVYFIPIIPAGKKVRVMNECSSCDMGSHVPLDEIEGMTHQIREVSELALKALLAGEAQFSIQGEALNSLPALLEVTSTLLALQEDKLVELTHMALKQQSGLSYEASIYEAQWKELQGHKDAAVSLYREAASINTQDHEPHLRLAILLIAMGKAQEAQPTLEHARSLVDDPLIVLPHLMEVYERLQNHEAHAQILEEIFQQAPQLSQDKSLQKRYKKACKKAGRPMKAA